MYLKSLEISGFKSFARKSLLEFKHSITAIVGPNGSGKSNVAEAFRFVLGEQSMKSMRGKRSEDMIFNGSNKVAKMNRASVKLVFDNTRRVLNIDFDEVTLERVVHRDGTNEYFINGSQVRLKDIIELLAAAHIGASGHHMISQGEADRILNSNIKDRRAMIEDALGLKIYQYKRIESERKLEKTEENMKQVESLRRELAPHLKFLKKQVEKIERAREMKNELSDLYREYFKREDIYLKHQQSFLEIEKRAPLAEMQALDAELAAARAALDQSKQENRRSGELLSLEDRIKSERINRDNLTRDLGRIEGEIAGLERNVRRLEQMSHADDSKTVALKDVIGLGDMVTALITEGEGKNSLDEIKSLLGRIREAVSSFVSNHRTKVDDTERDMYLQEIDKLKGEKADIEKRISDIHAREADLQNEYSSIKQTIEKEKEGGLQAEKTILRIMTRQNEINATFATLRALEEKLNLETTDFKRELTEAGILIGRVAVDYESAVLMSKDGQPLSVEAFMNEDRSVQAERRRTIERMKIRLEELGGGSGDDVMKEYRDSEERDAFLAKEITDLETSAASLRQLIVELTEKLDVEFKEGIKKINAQFQEFFALMFGGGNASLQVVKEERRRKPMLDALGEIIAGSDDDIDEEDDGQTEEGIDISVSLPNKKVKGLAMLSGGERALTSIALLFAMSQVNPPPFIILDETDAALDEANSRKYGNMVENLSKYSQLIVITHNRETMSRAGILYGVTMGADGISKLLSIHFEEAVQVAK